MHQKASCLILGSASGGERICFDQRSHPGIPPLATHEMHDFLRLQLLFRNGKDTGGLVVESLLANARDTGSAPDLGG